MLLIDDSHEDLFLVKRQLSRAGVKHPIVTIDGGEEAIVYLRACLAPGAEGLTPAAIFCDVQMPKQSGFDVLKWVRRHRALSAIPFFAMSGSDLDEDRSRAQELGATDYLVKSRTGDAVKAVLQAAGII